LQPERNWEPLGLEQQKLGAYGFSEGHRFNDLPVPVAKRQRFCLVGNGFNSPINPRQMKLTEPHPGIHQAHFQSVGTQEADEAGDGSALGVGGIGRCQIPLAPDLVASSTLLWFKPSEKLLQLMVMVPREVPLEDTFELAVTVAVEPQPGGDPRVGL
jgi:hypothetical protein